VVNYTYSILKKEKDESGDDSSSEIKQIYQSAKTQKDAI
jgi:hypothetical protein